MIIAWYKSEENAIKMMDFCRKTVDFSFIRRKNINFAPIIINNVYSLLNKEHTKDQRLCPTLNLKK